MGEFGSGPEKEKFITVSGNQDLVRKKLLAGLNIAFLMSEKNFTVYISTDNSHEKAAKAASLPSNNARGILLKGRIVPKVEAFDFIDNSNQPQNFLKDHLSQEQIDRLVPEVVSQLKNWLGEEFFGYKTHYKSRQADGSKRYSGD